jgi:RNA polymerase sigma factor (sigma-70 family)
MTREPVTSRSDHQVATAGASVPEPPSRAFAEVYAGQYDRLIRTATLLVGSVEQAEEIVQDAFASALPRWEEIRDHKAYLSAAVANGARNVYRAAASRERFHEPDSSTPEDSNRDLHASLLRLPYRQRAAIVLRYYVGIDDDSIANVLGCTRSTVRSSVRRGLQQLRREVQ